ERLAAPARALAPLVDRVAALADLESGPTAEWRLLAASHALAVALRAARRPADAPAAAEALVRAITEPLDRGIVLVGPSGQLVAANPAGARALALQGGGAGTVSPQLPVFYEDGSRCPSDDYPLARAVLGGASQPSAVRGHRVAPTETRWYAIRVEALRQRPDEVPYGFVAVLEDVTAEREERLRALPPAGAFARHEPVPLDVARVLDAVPAQLLPDQIVAEARRIVEAPVALYVVDIDGTHLLRLAGSDQLPARIKAPLALGPELAEEGLPGLRERLAAELPGSAVAPLWLRGRAVGILLALQAPAGALADIARQSALAMELANGYTDVFDAARRRKDINPAAEIQQSLLPPRIARFAGGQIAGGVLPSYDTGGDWFDYVDNRDGAWVAVADAAGRGAHAAALGSVALAALRAERRNDAPLEQAVATMHRTVCAGGNEEFFLTALVARWSPVHSSFSWISAGHPAPLLLQADGEIVELLAPAQLPLGLGPVDRAFRRSFRRLAADERLILYTDGVSARPLRDGLFGRDGIAEAVRAAGGRAASEIARSIQEHVVAASDRPLRDDAAVVVVAPGPVAPA
ncbi:MAG TPA: PP2C family protein-serine/threonine phosphatase, partial [Capillimicrobium sp.]